MGDDEPTVWVARTVREWEPGTVHGVFASREAASRWVCDAATDDYRHEGDPVTIGDLTDETDLRAASTSVSPLPERGLVRYEVGGDKRYVAQEFAVGVIGDD